MRQKNTCIWISIIADEKANPHSEFYVSQGFLQQMALKMEGGLEEKSSFKIPESTDFFLDQLWEECYADVSEHGVRTEDGFRKAVINSKLYDLIVVKSMMRESCGVKISEHIEASIKEIVEHFLEQLSGVEDDSQDVKDVSNDYGELDLENVASAEKFALAERCDLVDENNLKHMSKFQMLQTPPTNLQSSIEQLLCEETRNFRDNLETDFTERAALTLLKDHTCYSLLYISYIFGGHNQVTFHIVCCNFLREECWIGIDDEVKKDEPRPKTVMVKRPKNLKKKI
jgi:hypothetical protein